MEMLCIENPWAGMHLLNILINGILLSAILNLAYVATSRAEAAVRTSRTGRYVTPVPVEYKAGCSDVV
jgi:hypothetical protein